MGSDSDLFSVPGQRKPAPDASGFFHFHAQILYDASRRNHVRILGLVPQNARLVAPVLRALVQSDDSSVGSSRSGGGVGGVGASAGPPRSYSLPAAVAAATINAAATAAAAVDDAADPPAAEPKPEIHFN